MNDLEFSFEPDPWEIFRMSLTMGDTVSSSQLLTLLEEEDGQALEDALQDLETACVNLDISDLPKNGGTGETAVRLKQETQLVQEGMHPEALEPNDPLRLYLEEVAAVPVCGDEQLLAECCARDGSAAEKLTNLGLSRVIELAQEYVGYGVLLMDLIQEGSLGLWNGILNFDGGSFETVRDHWIGQYMARAVIRQARASGLGQKMRQAVEDYRMVDERLLSELGRNPTLDEIAEAMHMTVSEIEAVRKFLENARMVGKAHEVKEPEEESPEDTQAVEDTAYYQTRERVDSLMSGISELESKVVTLRYGLDGRAPQTAAEVGRKLNLTVSEVVELETAALTKMRQSGE